jgi:hypothetical protein
MAKGWGKDIDIEAKIESAFDRKEGREEGIKAKVENFVDDAVGWFRTADIVDSLGRDTSRDSIRQVLKRLVTSNVIERDPKTNGRFRKRLIDREDIGYGGEDEDPLKIYLPLRMDELVQVYPGNIVMIAGVTNMGKTAFMLDLARYNLERFKVSYFNSEMNAAELTRRLKAFNDCDIEYWKKYMRAYECPEDPFAISDIIERGPGNINIIDYIELDNEHYRISEILRHLHHRLDGAIAVVAVQKKPGCKEGYGGAGTNFKARLSLNIDRDKCTIMKAKNWARRDRNPNGLEMPFELVEGWRMKPHQGGWRTPIVCE